MFAKKQTSNTRFHYPGVLYILLMLLPVVLLNNGARQL